MLVVILCKTVGALKHEDNSKYRLFFLLFCYFIPVIIEILVFVLCKSLSLYIYLLSFI